MQQVGKIGRLQQVCAFLAVYPPSDMDNDFRQMSVLSQLAKVLKIIQHKSNKEDLNQHAFTHGGSTVTALASITQNWFDKTKNSCDGRMGIHALFIDFCKAFDLFSGPYRLLQKKTSQCECIEVFLV